jgi:hypothetical protein
VRLEIEDDIGFKWVLRTGSSFGERVLILMHSHNYFGREVDKPPFTGKNEYLCLHYYDSDKPNQPIDQRVWTCGSCSHKVPPEVERYYETVEWGLDTMMFDDEEIV